MKEIRPTDIILHDNADVYPTSLIQRQFWVLHSFDPNSSTYNIPLASVIEGYIDTDALESAFNTLLSKYQIFRTTFEIDDSGKLVQRFSPCEKKALPQVDLRPSQHANADGMTVKMALREEIRKSFDLATGPLLRFKLFRTAEHSHILSITAHHIVFDLTTSVLFAKELATSYSAALKGQIASQTVETAEYAQFCIWQENWLKSDECKKMEASWKHYLEGAESLLELPFDRPAQEESSPADTIVRVPLPRDLVERVTAFCRTEAVIPFLVLLAAWSLTLARLSNQCKLTIGVPLTNRRKDEFKTTMGCFVNILPLVLDLSGNPTMSEMLRNVRMAMLKMHRMQEIPYYHLVQMTRRTGKARGNPLFQAGFTFEQPMQLQLDGLIVKPEYIHQGGAQLDLFGKFWQEDDGINGVIEYDSVRFNAIAAKSIGQSFLSVIDELCSLPQNKTDIIAPSQSTLFETIDCTRNAMDAQIERHRHFWMTQLSGELPNLRLPIIKQQTDDQVRSEKQHDFNIPDDLYQEILSFADNAKVTPHIILLAAFQVLLMRYSSQEDILIGTVKESHPYGESTSATMATPFALRCTVSADKTFLEHVHEAYKVYNDAYEHRQYPLALLTSQLRQGSDPDNSAVFKIMFNFVDRQWEVSHLVNIELGNPTVTSSAMNSQDGLTNLVLEMSDYGHSSTGSLKYASSIYRDDDMVRLADHYTILLRGILTNPEKKLAHLPLMTEQEQNQLLVAWNDTKMSYPADACVHELFETQARLTPNAVAVVFENKHLTYSELDHRSKNFANHLRSLGVKPEDLIALYVERSLEMVIALLGILRAGGAYLPLDRIFPRDRLAFMIEDANPHILVTLTKLLDEIPPHHATVVCVDDYPQTAETLSSSIDYPTPENLAYVLYTSGSTGKPKGVEISHRALVNFLTSMRKEPGLETEDTLLSVTTISFDILGLELWLPLINGATVVIVAQEVTIDGQRLAAIMADYKVTVMQATPSTWHILLESGWGGNHNLKILCGGEAWSRELADALLPRCASLWNMYGPTETTIWSAVCQIRNGDQMSLGRPIANTQFYIVDKHLQLLPAGMPGELLIGGDGLARGYKNRPELTAEKFIPDPFSGKEGARLYRTGDTVRYLSDGRLEFIGRLDQQVKIRGFRIELGDIETVLCAKPGIKQAVVVVYGEEEEKYLVAYIVTLDGFIQQTTDVRAYLKQTLPVYMIPTKFVFLPGLPLTPNGKVNRKALPRPDKLDQKKISSSPPGEMDPRIIEWNRTDRPYPLNKCLHRFIEEQAAISPFAPALTCEDKTISYEELNKRVNQLAHFLQSKGVGAETLVGVCAFRSTEMVIALLAIITAGGAYVPLDPTYPVKRLAFMINDSRVPLVLAHKNCSALLNADLSEIIYFENISEILESFPITTPSSHTGPDNLAYVIYTSGSTGNPRGAMNTHKGIVNRLLWMQETFCIGQGDTVVQKTPFSFDVSVWEFFWPFMYGARLVVAKHEGHKDADYLCDLIQRENITIIHFVPSMLRLFLDKADKRRCKSLRHVVLSGESLTSDLQKRYFTILDKPLHNLYGPTEAAVDVSYWKCDPGQNDIIPIGRPISNTRLYILGTNGNFLPIGESGELHIGGVQVARGYLNHPDLTEKKFIRDPFSADPAARLYKTGDLCRFLPDGNIEYLGRIDFQVKIRGNRVELGEIEAAILQNPSVKDCAVILREDTPGEQRLVAYIVENQVPLSQSAIRQKLANDLPDYMIPAVFIRMPRLPLSPNGKVDRSALPIPNRERPELANEYAAPRSEIERLIVKTWQDLLPVDAVGLDDNFFDLGGHSLLLVRMATRLKNLFRKDISVMNLFEHPTIREQVDFILGKKKGNKPPIAETSPRRHTSTKENDWEDGEI